MQQNGLTPLHWLLTKWDNDFIKPNTLRTLRTLQVLVTFGATWDAECQKLVAAGKAWDEAPALKLCMSFWAQEFPDGLDLSIPLENIQRGEESTQTYLESLKGSSKTVLRRKICLIGPSCAGKTSFVKSITTTVPQLEHIDDRTIGIDRFPLQFEQQSTDHDKPKIHEVTFWDFAGQDAYQVAHTLFFSPRTLYFVFVDLEAYAIAYKQAMMFADDDDQESKLLDEFFERGVRQWIRLVVARQHEAEFVFIATKHDLLLENDYMKRRLKQELRSRLQGVLADVQVMKSPGGDETIPSVQGSRTNEEPTILYTSCTSNALVEVARAKVQALVAQSNFSFPMPEEYSNVLDAIVITRNNARDGSVKERISQTFAPMNKLLNKLAELGIDRHRCRNILQTLHDLGHVLWFEKLDIETIVLDPLLPIDFIREIINHKHTDVKISHADLEGKPLWRNLGDDNKLTKAMKQHAVVSLGLLSR